MTRNFFLWTAICFLAVAFASCENNKIEERAINSAISIQVYDVTASAATVEFSTEQTENVASYLYVGPIPADRLKYLELDPIQRLETLEENGVEAEAPFLQTFSNLNSKTTYVVGLVAKNAAGKYCSAPTFATFSTFSAKAEAYAELTSEADGEVVYTYRITPNEYTASVKYIFSLKEQYVKATEEELKAAIQEGGEDVLTLNPAIATTETFISTTKEDAILAVLAYDEVGRPGEYASFFVATSSSVAVMIDGQATILAQPDEEVEYFEGMVNLPAAGTFTLMINAVEYGFIPFSGNGGIGTVNNLKAAVPFYNLTPEHTRKYIVRKAIGQMDKITNGAVPFWTNMTDGGLVKVVVDGTNEDGIYRYYLERPTADNVVLEEGFDLFVFGGDYTLGNYKATSMHSGSGNLQFPDELIGDGTKPGTPDIISYTSAAIDVFSSIPDDNSDLASEIYLKNRGMEGWELCRVCEHAGGPRIGKSASTSDKYNGYILTPKLTALTGATDVTLELDVARFAGDADAYISIVGSGTYTAAEVNVDAAETATPFPAEGTDFIITAAMCSKQANSVVNKPIVHVKLSITGANADTQIKIDMQRSGAMSSNTRLYVDRILVTK